MQLSEIDAAINGAKDRWGHADAQHNEDMLALIAAAEAMREKLYGPDGYDPMPVFVIKAKDSLAIAAVSAYHRLCKQAGLDDQAAQVRLAEAEMSGWRERNADEVDHPNHQHIPVSGQLGSHAC